MTLCVSLISHYTSLSEPHLMMCFPGCEEQCLSRNDDLLQRLATVWWVQFHILGPSWQDQYTRPVPFPLCVTSYVSEQETL